MVEQEPLLRRILVAVDASPHSLAALEAAAELAAKFEAELIGLYVEDIDVLRLATLPFAREVRYYSSDLHDFNSDEVESNFRRLAEVSRSALEAAVRQAQTRHRFRVVRSDVTRAVLQAAQEADLIILGRASHPHTPRSQLGSTAAAVVRQAPYSVLLLQHGVALGQPAVVLYDSSPGASRTLAAAVALSSEAESGLILVICAEVVEEAQLLQQKAQSFLRAKGRRAIVRTLLYPTATAVVRLVADSGGKMLFITADHALVASGAVQTLLEERHCAVMLVR